MPLASVVNSGQLSIGLWSYPNKHNRIYDSIIIESCVFGYTDNQGILLGNRGSRYEPWGSSIQRAWFSSWYVVSIHTGHIAQSPQSSPRWSPAFKMEPVHSVSSFSISEYSQHIEYIYTSVFGRCIKWFWTLR